MNKKTSGAAKKAAPQPAQQKAVQMVEVDAGNTMEFEAGETEAEEATGMPESEAGIQDDESPTRQVVRRPNRELEAGAVSLGKEQEVQIPLKGSVLGKQGNLKPRIEEADGPKNLSKEEELVFMNEMVEIVISESDNPNAENPVPVGVNGRMGYIYRGQPTLVRRCYVERLARAKSDNFKQNLTEKDPEKYNVLKLTRGLRYPFTVTRDPNKRGRDWLIKILREA